MEAFLTKTGIRDWSSREYGLIIVALVIFVGTIIGTVYLVNYLFYEIMGYIFLNPVSGPPSTCGTSFREFTTNAERSGENSRLVLNNPKQCSEIQFVFDFTGDHWIRIHSPTMTIEIGNQYSRLQYPVFRKRERKYLKVDNKVLGSGRKVIKLINKNGETFIEFENLDNGKRYQAKSPKNIFSGNGIVLAINREDTNASSIRVCSNCF